MKTLLKNFPGVLLGILIYSGLIQYTDTGTIDVAGLLFDFKPWIIAILVAFVLSLLEPVMNRKTEQ